MPTNIRRITSALLLVFAALIWGVAFVAQSVGGESVGPFTFMSVRSFIAGIALLPLTIFRLRRNRLAYPDRKPLWKGGILCGIILAFATSLQQYGLQTTSVGKAGFISSLYMIFVPVAALIFFRRRSPFFVWVGVVCAVAGMYFLSIREDFTIALGDTYVLLCAICFTGHILVVDRISPRVDCVQLSCIQFFVYGFATLIPALIFEHPSLDAILSIWLPLVYAGAFSGGIGYTLQIVAQKHVPPALAGVLMSLESVFSALAGWLILKEQLDTKEVLGCLLVFSGVILSQLPEKKKK